MLPVGTLLDIFLRNIILRNGLIPTRLFIDKNLSQSRGEIFYSRDAHREMDERRERERERNLQIFAQAEIGRAHV